MVCPAFCSSTWWIRGNHRRKRPTSATSRMWGLKAPTPTFLAICNWQGDRPQLFRAMTVTSLYYKYYNYLKILQQILLPLTLVTPKQVKSSQPVSLHSSADLTRKAQSKGSIVEKEKSQHATSRSKNSNFNWPHVKTCKPPASLSFCTTRLATLATSISLQLHVDGRKFLRIVSHGKSL